LCSAQSISNGNLLQLVTTPRDQDEIVAGSGRTMTKTPAIPTGTPSAEFTSSKPERFGGLEIDHRLNLGWLQAIQMIPHTSD